MNPVHLEWLGAAFGLSGSFLLASTTRHSRYAWLLFAVSNVSLAAFAAIHSYFCLLLLNLGFGVSSSLGIYNNFWRVK